MCLKYETVVASAKLLSFDFWDTPGISAFQLLMFKSISQKTVVTKFVEEEI